MSQPSYPTLTDVPYVPYPPDPKQDELAGQPYCWYIQSEQMNEYVRTLSAKIELQQYDHVLYVLQGARWLYDRLTTNQDYPHNYDTQAIEYHGHPGHGEARISKPVPSDLKGELLIVDDVWDSGNTGKLIVDDIHRLAEVNSITIAVVAYKQDIPNRVHVPGITLHAAVRIDNQWLGGCGMDMGTTADVQQQFRQLDGLVVKK